MSKGELVDLFQSAAMLLIAVTQVLIWLAIRNEMRRAASAVNVMSRAVGENSDTLRRVEQIEQDLADLVHRVERAIEPG